MYTPEDRDRVRSNLLDRAREDPRISGAALTGSAALDNEDRWSDVDVFLGVAEDNDIDDVAADWTEALVNEAGVVHHWDVRSGAALYRVFLLESGLHVDVAFTPHWDFGARGASFRIVFGDPVDMAAPLLPTFTNLAGLGWLSVLHADAAIEREKPWAAAFWIASVRDQTIAAACLRLGEHPMYARGVDGLPPDVTGPLEETLVASLAPEELRRALRVARRCLLDEIGATDAALAGRLESALVGG